MRGERAAFAVADLAEGGGCARGECVRDQGVAGAGGEDRKRAGVAALKPGVDGGRIDTAVEAGRFHDAMQDAAKRVHESAAVTAAPSV